MALSASEIRRLFELLNSALQDQHVMGEIFLVGGAVMCLVYNTRASTKDVDAYFSPSAELRRAAKKIAAASNLPEDWLNDAVKGYLSPVGDFSTFLELSNLRVMAAEPQYLLAMKCLAFRIGEEFHDEEDVRFLLRYLNLDSWERAREIIKRYYPLERFPQKTLYALEELLAEKKRRAN